MLVLILTGIGLYSCILISLVVKPRVKLLESELPPLTGQKVGTAEKAF